MDKAAEFYLRNSNLKQDWAIREAKGFSRWWGLYFARTASPTDANLKIAMDAWRDARQTPC